MNCASTTSVEAIRARNRATLEKYLGRGEAGEPVIFDGSPDSLAFTSNDHRVQIPFSPPGQFRELRREDMSGMLEWVENTFPAPFQYTIALTHETEDPRVFWTEDHGLGMTTWRGGFVYANRHVMQFRFDDEGDICYECEYFDPASKFRIDLTPLPEWDYNQERVRVGLEPVVMPPKGRTHTYPLLVEPAKQATPDVKAQKHIQDMVQRFKTEDRFLEGRFDAKGTWVPDQELLAGLAEDFSYELPWTPDGMLKLYDSQERLALSQFLAKSMSDFRLVKQYFWATTDPTVFIFEDEREATVTWRGGGTYRNRHVGVIRFNSKGDLLSWCEYLNPMQFFTMDGTEWPEWDVNEERARVGLGPVLFSWERTHVMPELE